MALPTPEEAVDLMYRSSTTGVPSSEFAKYDGGYAAVKAIAQAASFDATPTFVQSYEQSSGIPASASTIANEQFIGDGGAERFAQQEADLMSSDAALAAATRQRSADQFAAAQATVAARAPVTARQTAAQSATGLSIVEAYKRVLGRIPNADEIAYWTNVYGYNVDPTELSNFSVAAQPERVAASVTDDPRTQNIRKMYLSVLGREPDASGLKYFYDRFGDTVEPGELDIFKGMATQEVNANAARNAALNTGTTTRTGTTTGTGTTTRTGTTTGTVQPITRPPPVRQVTGTQFAPAAVTNTAITGTPFNNIYQPSTMQQNAPLLSDIQAAAQSANPYQSLMSLTPQRTLSPAYAAQAGLTTYNTNLGGYDSSLNNAGAGLLAPSTIVGGGGADGVNNSGDQRGPGTNNTASNIDPLAVGMARVANLFSSGTQLNPAPIVNRDISSTYASDNEAFDRAFSAAGGDNSGSNTAPSPGERGGEQLAKGGKVNMKPQMHNPPGPDDGYAALDNGEYVIRKSAVKKYGSNIFEQINAGKIPAQRLKSLLE